MTSIERFNVEIVLSIINQKLEYDPNSSEFDYLWGLKLELEEKLKE